MYADFLPVEPDAPGKDGTAKFGDDLEICRMDRDGSVIRQSLPDYWSEK